MASNFKTPGVYIQEISKFPPSVAQVETAIPAFIGYTQRAQERAQAGDLHFKPKRITSLLEYERYYGTGLNETGITVTFTGSEVIGTNGAPSQHNMYYAMQAFFANGGGPCYVISVGDMSAAAGGISLGTPGGAVNDGLIDGLGAAAKVDEVTLLVFPESQALAIGDYKTLMDSALLQCETLKDRFVVMDMPSPAAGETILDAATTFRSSGVGPTNLKYGAAYSPNVETVFNYLYADADVQVSLEDGSTATMDQLNPENEGAEADAGLYNAARRAVEAIPINLPPSPLVVGVYAAVDSSRGVWKAPANVGLIGVERPAVDITAADQASLNVDTTGKSVNAIRTFAGKGTMIWGARTLAGNDNEWRYVPVRRFFNMVEESVMKASEQFVFEPNDANTWVKVRAMIENFLLLQWRAGALAGAKPEDAFFVRVGLPETMTSLDILEGRMNVEIGMAVVRPAEFIILKFSHKMQVS